MKIKIIKQGHQYYREIIGEVVNWCQTAEMFNKIYLNVPAVMVKTEKNIECIPLKSEFYWYEIEIM